MGNYLLFLAGVLYFFGLSWGSYLGFWLSVEAAGLVIISGFFSYSSAVNRYTSLLYYLLISGLSSTLFFSGMLSNSFNGFLVISAAIKGGIFPFIGWVLLVYSNCSWSLLFFLGVVSKVMFLYFPFIVAGCSDWVIWFSIFSFIICSALFWINSFNVKVYLAISSIGSFCVLFPILLSSNVWGGTLLYAVYCGVSGISFIVLYYLESGYLSSLRGVYLFFILLGIPCSLALLYKFTTVLLLTYFPLSFLVVWVFFSISEQIYLCFMLLEKVSINSVV